MQPQPVASRGTRDRLTGRRDQADAGRTSPRDAAKSRSRDVKDKPVAEQVREWDRHKLRQSPAKEKEDRDKRGREGRSTKARDRKEGDRRERERSRHDQRGREKTEKPG